MKWVKWPRSRFHWIMSIIRILILVRIWLDRFLLTVKLSWIRLRVITYRWLLPRQRVNRDRYCRRKLKSNRCFRISWAPVTVVVKMRAISISIKSTLPWFKNNKVRLWIRQNHFMQNLCTVKAITLRQAWWPLSERKWIKRWNKRT